AAPCTSAGASAIGVDGYYRGVHTDVLNNTVHDIGPAGCRFDQGIYMSTSGVVRNNVVYRVAEAGIHLWHDANHVVIAHNTVAAWPRFVGYTRTGTPDFRPAPDSPAIGRAIADDADPADAAGRARNAKAGYDIGAYQH